MRLKAHELFPREHGFYVMAILPAAAGVALNWEHAASAAMAGLSWVLLVLSSTGVKTWIVHPSRRPYVTAPVVLAVLIALAGFVLSGVPAGLMVACGMGLGSLAIHFLMSPPKERRSVQFESVAAFVLGFGMLVSGSAGYKLIPLPIAQAALVYTLVQVAATVHVRLWIEALGSHDEDRRAKFRNVSLLVHAGLIGLVGVFCFLGWLPIYSLLPGVGEGLVVIATLSRFGRKVSFPKLGIAQTVGLVVAAVGLAIQFQP